MNPNLLAILLIVVAGAASAQGPNMAEMSKWASAKLIHYHVVGDGRGLYGNHDHTQLDEAPSGD